MFSFSPSVQLIRISLFERSFCFVTFQTHYSFPFDDRRFHLIATREITRLVEGGTVVVNYSPNCTSGGFFYFLLELSSVRLLELLSPLVLSAFGLDGFFAAPVLLLSSSLLLLLLLLLFPLIAVFVSTETARFTYHQYPPKQTITPITITIASQIDIEDQDMFMAERRV